MEIDGERWSDITELAKILDRQGRQIHLALLADVGRPPDQATF